MPGYNDTGRLIESVMLECADTDRVFDSVMPKRRRGLRLVKP